MLLRGGNLRVSGWFDDVTGVVEKAVETPVSIVGEVVGGVKSTTSTLGQTIQGVAGQVAGTVKASGADTVGLVQAYKGGGATAAAPTIPVTPVPDNTPLYIGGAAVAVVLLMIFMRKPARAVAPAAVAA